MTVTISGESVGKEGRDRHKVNNGCECKSRGAVYKSAETQDKSRRRESTTA